MTADFHQLGKYQIIEELGAGGFATVFRALDTSLDREVALKILHPPLLADRQFVQNFRQEARTLARLRHPQIITIYEVGETDGRMFIAMDLVNGLNMARSILKRTNQRIAWAETLVLLKPICEALDYAHAQQIVHRDLKPANVLIDSQRGAMLTDFGFAKLMANNAASMTISGGIVGTPGYIAPEVWESNAADPPVDIYALGCIAYEMLTGDVLFKGATPIQAMRAHDRGPQFPPAWPTGVPSDVSTVLARALAHEPAGRYPSASAFWQALGSVGQPAATTMAPRPAEAQPAAPTHTLPEAARTSTAAAQPAEIRQSTAAPKPSETVNAHIPEPGTAALPAARGAPAEPVNVAAVEKAGQQRKINDLGLAIAMLPLGVALDIGGGELVKRFQLPLWLDNAGTILMGGLFGPWVGALAAVAGRVAWWLLGWNDYALWFSPSVVLVGIMAGFAGRLGLFRHNPPRGLSALIGGVLGFGVALLTLMFLTLSPNQGAWPSLPAASELVPPHGPQILAATALGVAAGFFVLKNVGYAGLAGLISGMIAAIMSAPISAIVFDSDAGSAAGAAIFGQQTVPDPLDKLILFLIVFLIVRLLPRPLLQRFPNTRGQVDADAKLS